MCWLLRLLSSGQLVSVQTAEQLASFATALKEGTHVGSPALRSR